MDALADQHILLAQRQVVAVVLPDALFKVELGNFHRLAVQKPGHVRVELLDVHSAEALKIVLPVLVPGRLGAVFEIVVGRNRVRKQPACQKLCAQAMRKGGLARGGRPGDHNEAHARTGGNLGGNITDSFVGNKTLNPK